MNNAEGRINQQLVCCQNDKAKLQRRIDELTLRLSGFNPDVTYGVITYSRSNVGCQVLSLKDDQGNDVEVVTDRPGYLTAFPILNQGEAIIFKINKTMISVNLEINVPSSSGSSTIDAVAYSGIIDSDNFGFGAGGGSGNIILDIDLGLNFLFITVEG